jgi:hypothetical protein
MVDPVKIAFERKIIIQPIADLLPTKGLPAGVRETVKYRRIAASVAEVGLIEPLRSPGRKEAGPFAARWPYAARCPAISGRDRGGLRRGRRR